MPVVRTRPSAKKAAGGRLPGAPAGSSPVAEHRISFDSEDDEVAVEDVRLDVPAASGGPQFAVVTVLQQAETVQHLGMAAIVSRKHLTCYEP